MEFTKEELIAGKKLLDAFDSQNNFRNYDIFLNSLLKPETKFIDVRIEYDADKITFEMNDHAIRNILNCGCSDDKVNFKVTELSEVFTRKDMIQFADYRNYLKDVNTETCLNRFFSERKSK